MAAIADADVSIDASGNIRWEGAATTNRHTVLEFIQWLMDKQDDEQAAGDDLLDITVDTPFDRSTDQIVTLNSPFNIDDTFATHLYDGSVTQNTGDDVYSGLEVLGPVETGTEYMVLQDGKVLPAFWGTGINAPGGASLVFSRHLVKTREGGADIDGKRITVLARELGDGYRRFPVTMGTGNSVAAIGNGQDIFNGTVDATIAGWDSITNTEGFQLLDIDADGADEEYYSQWNVGTQTINDTYERSKWITQRSHVADSNAETGNDNIIDNATITGQATEWSATADGEILTSATLRIKIGSEVGGLTGSVYCQLYDSDDVATAAPTGAVLARSESIPVSAFTTSYEDTIFRFNRIDPSDGTDQINGLTLVADQEYFVAVRHDEGDADDYLQVEGDATSADDGNRAHDTAGWTGVASDALNFSVTTSPAIHGIPGEIFQGINVEVGFSGESGAGILESAAATDEIAIWGTHLVYDTLVGTFQDWEYCTIHNGATWVSAGLIMYDDGVNDMVVSLENPTAALLADGYTITGLTSGATADINVTINDDDLSGGFGLVLAKDDNGTTGELYLQVLGGNNPVNTNVIRSTAGDPITAFCNATATINSRPLNPEFLGTSTGSNIIGTYGIGFDTNDVGASDLFRALDNSTYTPPNNQTFTVSGLVSGEDRVLVGPRNGTALDRGQFLLSTALTGATETAVVVKDGTETVTPIADDIPGVGTGNTGLRIELDSGIYRKQAYNTVTRASDTFNITSADYSGANQAAINNDVFVAFIDVLADASTEAYTAEFVSARDLFVRVRDGGTAGDGIPIKTFESDSAQFLGTPQTVAAVRTDDA